MHVASEEGEYVFKKSSLLPTLTKRDHNIVEVLNPDMAVCGLYVVTDPDKFVEISIKYMDINCETGGLMSVINSFLFFVSLCSDHNCFNPSNKNNLICIILCAKVCGWLGAQ